MLDKRCRGRIRVPLAHLATPPQASAPGFGTEQLFGTRTDDDWEPAVAADPAAPYVYILTTRYGGKKACNDCPDPALILPCLERRRTDVRSGPVPVRVRGHRGQNDPQIEVARDGTRLRGVAERLRAWRSCSRSSIDHGRTWSAPVTLKTPAIEFGDKPALAISPTGRDVYVAWNASDSYISVSHDFGATFAAPVKTNTDTRYWFAYAGAVAPDGTVTFSETTYTQDSTGPVRIEAIRSTDGGKHWHDDARRYRGSSSRRASRTVVRSSSTDRRPSMAMDATGRLVVMYQGASVAGRPATGVRPPLDRRRQDLVADAPTSTAARPARTRPSAARPRPATATSGSWYQDDRNGPAGWNTWFRRSTDGGVTWSTEARLSDRPNGRVHTRSRAGFAQPYGDYGEVAITNTEATIAVWGEGTSYTGPGGTWYSLSTDSPNPRPAVSSRPRPSPRRSRPGGRGTR